MTKKMAGVSRFAHLQKMKFVLVALGVGGFCDALIAVCGGVLAG